MTTETIYAYNDLNHQTVMVSEGNLNMVGEWSSSGTYLAESKDTVDYGAALYLALVDNIGVNPTQAPRKGQQAKWSTLSVISRGTHFDDHTADEAYALALQALGAADEATVIAVAGTNVANNAQNSANSANDLAQRALLTAWSGTAGVDQAIQIAVNGTNAAQTAIGVVASAASAAQSSANAAQSTANGAQIAADGAQSSANGARTVADAAFSIAVAGTNAAASAQSTADANAHERVGFSFVLDGAGAVITSGFKGNVEVPFAMWLNQWTLVADQSGSLVVDITKSNQYAGFPTVSSITDADRPTLNNVQKNQNTNPSAWVRQLNAGDIVGFTVVGAGTVQNATIALSGTRS